MESCSNQKRVKQIKIYVIFEILQSSHPLPWWQLCTLLAFSQPASWGSHLECISNKSSFVEFLSFLMSLSQSVVLWQGRCGIQEIEDKFIRVNCTSDCSPNKMLHRVQVTDTSTVQRRLRESGHHGQIAAKKPILKDTNKKKRLAWSKKHDGH